jgi:hypothetical protein
LIATAERSSTTVNSVISLIGAEVVQLPRLSQPSFYKCCQTQ